MGIGLDEDRGLLVWFHNHAMIVVWFSQSCDNCEVLFPSLAHGEPSARLNYQTQARMWFVS